MKTNNIFNSDRFLSLFRQNLIHNARMILITLVALSGGLFILLMLPQIANHDHVPQYRDFMGLFLFIFIALGIIYSGMAFPGFRSKEKCFSYLLNPASNFEKYLFEIINRIFVFIILVPLIYWIVYYIEGNMMHVINPSFEFHTYWYFNHNMPAPVDFDFWAKLLTVNLGLLIFFIPFTGASAFIKVPLIKTMFSIAVIVFIQAMIVYLMVKIVGPHEFAKVHEPAFLWIETKEGVIQFAAVYTLLINLAMLSVSYFKLKEKEA